MHKVQPIWTVYYNMDRMSTGQKNISPVFVNRGVVLSELSFQLSAVVVHFGNDNRGHYVTFIPTQNSRWVRISDHIITEDMLDIDVNSVLAKHAVICVYRQVNMHQNKRAQVETDSKGVSTYNSIATPEHRSETQHTENTAGFT